MKKNTHSSEQEFEALVLRRLLRRQNGESEDAATQVELAARIAADPACARLAERLEQTWQGLELAPVGEASVAPLLLARLRGDELRWSLAPNWARAAAALALVAGLGAGWGLGLGFEPNQPEPARPAAAAAAENPTAESPTAENPTAESPAELQMADLQANPLADSFADAFGADSDYSEPGFAESFWLAAESDPYSGEVQ